MKKKWNLLQILLFAGILQVGAQVKIIPAIKKETWKGFEKVSFNIAGHEAWYVKPAKALTGKPWVWRASFPNWHTDMDSILLAKGFHVFFVNVDDQYGSPYAMQVWDKSYFYLVDSLSFAPKPALEAVSRGGLYAYGWAKRNPDKVSCIYAEAPVCDIMSWPAGKGKGAGDINSWKQCLAVLQLTEETAGTYRDIPLNNLDGMAAYRVPVLHVVSNEDKIVPVAENTSPLINNYLALNGPATVFPVISGPQDLQGHHFPIDKAAEWADFVMKNSYPIKNEIKQDKYLNIRNGIEHVHQKLVSGKAVTVAFVGGSITFNDGWRDKTANYLTESFPKTEFKFIRAAIPSLGSLPHVFRISTDLPQLNLVDLLFVEAAVNDRVNGTDSLTQVRALEGIIKQAKKANPAMDIVMMSFADPDKNNDYSSRKIPVEIQNHEKVAAYYHLPSINLAKMVHDKLANKEFSWTYDFKDLHPAVYGQELYFSAIKRLLFKTLFERYPAEQQKYPFKNLNTGSFTNAGYVPIEQAKLGKGWEMVKDWTPTDGLGARPGFVHVPMLVATTPGASISFPFQGSAVGISIVSGADAGMIEYAIDGKSFQKLDLFTQWSSSLHLPWYLLLADDLPFKKHVLTLKISADKNKNSTGNACRIVHFLVNKKE
ncbi:GDSL-type esterase/lipase family protein [Pedobacter sp. GSP4]|uniref:GDSL-type esterase/lipase family protein n=1 Tax=Pedobacter sp. GSP4 TaxID=3453716 RepID=UPI003EEBAC3E